MASRRQSKSSRAKRRAKKRSVKLRSQWRDDLAEQLGDHRPDMVAILLTVVGVLSLLAMFSDIVGPVGRGIDSGAAVLLGRGKILIPIALLAGAVCAVAQRRADDEDDDTPARIGLRFGLGLVLVCGTAVGGFHLARGKTADGSLEPLKRAGGNDHP